MKKLRLSTNPEGSRSLMSADYKRAFNCPLATCKGEMSDCGDWCAWFDIEEQVMGNLSGTATKHSYVTCQCKRIAELIEDKEKIEKANPLPKLGGFI